MPLYMSELNVDETALVRAGDPQRYLAHVMHTLLLEVAPHAADATPLITHRKESWYTVYRAVVGASDRLINRWASEGWQIDAAPPELWQYIRSRDERALEQV